MTLSPLERYQQQLQMKQQRKKKSDNTGLYVLIGSMVALLVVVIVVMKMRSDDSGQVAKPTSTSSQEGAHVDLSLAKQKELYKDWCELGGMGSPAEARYKILRGRYGTPASQVRLIVAHGSRNNWPRGVQ